MARRRGGRPSRIARRAQIAATAFALFIVAPAAALADRRRSDRAELPEPILTESATDLDADHGGEIEVSLNALDRRDLHGGSGALHGSLELEWRAFEWLGFRLEPSLRYPIGGGAAAAPTGGLDTTVAASLLRDFVRDVYLQIEGSADLYDGGSHIPSEPGQPLLPFDLILRGGARRGAFTFRASLGVETDFTHSVAPRMGIAVLYAVGRSHNAGFFGVEFDSDWARINPYTIAPNVQVDLRALDIPVRVCLAIPTTFATGNAPGSLGMFLRALVEIDRGGR